MGYAVKYTVHTKMIISTTASAFTMHECAHQVNSWSVAAVTLDAAIAMFWSWNHI